MYEVSEAAVSPNRFHSVGILSVYLKIVAELTSETSYVFLF